MIFFNLLERFVSCNKVTGLVVGISIIVLRQDIGWNR